MDSKIRSYKSRKIYDALEMVRLKPYIFLTSKSIIALQNFINGYMQLGIGDDIYYPGEPTIKSFQSWISDTLGTDLDVRGLVDPFSTFFLNRCQGDEVRAFDAFFEYLEVFKKDVANARNL